MEVPAWLELLGRGALWLAFALLVQSCARRSSAALRYRLWSIALGGLVLLPLFALAPAIELPAPAFLAVERAPLTLPAGPGAPLGSPPAPGTPEAAPASALELQPLILVVWLAGVAALLGLHLLRRAALARCVRRAEPLSGPAWDEPLRRAASAAGVRRAVRLVASAEIAVPLVLGLRRPVIALPARAREWDEACLFSVLLHELAHVRRGDEAVQVLAVLARALHWPDPLAWWAHAGLVLARERSCDDRVLGWGVPASAYARHLLAVASELQACRPRQALAMAGSPEIAGRVRAVLDPSRARRTGAGGRVLLAALALAAPLGALRLRAAEGDPLERVRALVALRARPALDEHALALLLEALGDDRRVDPRAVPLAVGGPRLGGLPETTSGKEAARVLVRRGAAAVEALRAALAEHRAPAREKAAWALGCQGARGAAGDLARLLERDESPDVRRIAAWALGEMGARDQRAALEAALGDASAAVRAQSAHSLGDLGDPRALPALLVALRDPVPGVRERAAHGLGDLAQSSAVPALRAALADPDPDARAMAAWALRESGGAP